MRSKMLLLTIICICQGMVNISLAQQNSHLTVVYDITVNKFKKQGGIEETYNGGTKSVFISHNKVRIRLSSLMRIESIFFVLSAGKLTQASIVKESGEKKYRYNLQAEEWKQYNKKYDAVTCTFQDDSAVIAGYQCKKAIIHLSSGEQIVAYYTISIPAVNDLIEPAFKCIPGTVLQYEYTSKKGTMVFKASQVSQARIADDVFTIPAAGVETRKYNTEENND